MGFLWQLRLGQLLLLICLGSTGSHVNADMEIDIERSKTAAVGRDGMPCDVKFSECWMDTLRSGEVGLCNSAVDYYKWRGSGYGSNMNRESYASDPVPASSSSVYFAKLQAGFPQQLLQP